MPEDAGVLYVDSEDGTTYPVERPMWRSPRGSYLNLTPGTGLRRGDRRRLRQLDTLCFRGSGQGRTGERGGGNQEPGCDGCEAVRHAAASARMASSRAESCPIEPRLISCA